MKFAWTIDNHKALEIARAAGLTPARAREIHAWKNWHHGGGEICCGPGPDFPDMTDIEKGLVHALWLTLPGWTSWMDALSLLEREENPRKPEGIPGLTS